MGLAAWRSREFCIIARMSRRLWLLVLLALAGCDGGSSTPPPPEEGACCAPSGCVEDQTQAECDGRQGAYFENLACSDVEDYCYTARPCCLPSGMCSMLELLDCQAAEGVPNNNPTGCVVVTCPAP